mmetsp:Transcript_44472/g.128533  ORF Transcript_44472/g.128533 Transcript_44472/m.128533 type:complete len:279 (-) Transcript_44472:89-925(-)
MANECCFGNRPPLEKLRNLCITCLVLDSIFVLINGLYTLTSVKASKAACYEAHGFAWHNMILFTFGASTGVAAGGMMVHAAVSCAAEVKSFQIVNVSRFAYILIGWTFFSAVLETVAAREEPEACKDPVDAHSGAYASDAEQKVAEAEANKHAMWQIVYTMLSLAWITTTVVASILGRRLTQVMTEGGVACPTSGTASEAQQQHPSAQTVGWPTSMRPGSDSAVGAPIGGLPPDGGVNGGWPNNGGAFPGVVVAQGRPVPGSTHDPDRPALAAPKVVD